MNHIYLFIFRLLLIFIITFPFIFINRINESFAPNIPNTLQTTEVPADFGSINNPSSRISGVVDGKNIVIESKGRTVWEPEYSTIWNGRWIYHGTVESYRATLNINTVQFLIIDINRDGEGIVEDQFFNFKINVKNAGANILTGLIPSGKYNGWRATLRLLPTDLAYIDPSRPFPVKMRYFIQQSNTILNLSSGNINNMQGYSTKFVGDRLVLANFLEASGIQTEANVAFSSQDLAKINNNIREQRTPRPIDIANRFLGNRIRSHRLLYRATVNGWTAGNFRQLANNRGPTITIATLQDGRFIGAYNPLSWGVVNYQYIPNPDVFLFDRERQYTYHRSVYGGQPTFNIYENSSYGPTFGGGHDFLSLLTTNPRDNPRDLMQYVSTFMDNSNRGPLGVNRFTSAVYPLRDLEVFSVTFDNISQPTAQPAVLYTFTTHTFTNAGATGREGPTLEQVRKAYSGVSWAQNSQFLNMTTQGIQEWRVPVTGNYQIVARGAKGGNQHKWDDAGNGRVIELTTNLIKGEIIKILVGQKGLGSTTAGGGGGGGGTFVIRDKQTPILIAGGGGSVGSWFNASNTNASNSSSGLDAPKDYNGGRGGSNGSGGGNVPHGGGGGGLIGNGSSDERNIFEGKSFAQGGQAFIFGGKGGDNISQSRHWMGGGGIGGFGGGGSNCCGGGGAGGGGYSGGAGFGGGGSIGISAFKDHGATSTGDGSVTITMLPK